MIHIFMQLSFVQSSLFLYLSTQFLIFRSLVSWVLCHLQAFLPQAFGIQPIPYQELLGISGFESQAL